MNKICIHFTNKFKQTNSRLEYRPVTDYSHTDITSHHPVLLRKSCLHNIHINLYVKSLLISVYTGRRSHYCIFSVTEHGTEPTKSIPEHETAQ